MRKPAKTVLKLCAAAFAAWALFSLVLAAKPFSDGFANAATAPFGRFARASVRAASAAWRSATGGARAVAECAALRAENERLAVEAAGAAALRAENDALRQELSFAARERSFVAAEVISDGGASGWSSLLKIDRGRRDGIAPGAPVVTPAGLVGRVVSAEERTARVMPVTDPNCRVSCVVEGLGRAGHGILEGGGVAHPVPEMALLHVVEPLEASFIGNDVVLKPGARVFTAGDGLAYPPGIPVGLVVGVDQDSTRLFQRARVRPAVSPRSLRRVFVLTERAKEGR